MLLQSDKAIHDPALVLIQEQPVSGSTIMALLQNVPQLKSINFEKGGIELTVIKISQDKFNLMVPSSAVKDNHEPLKVLLSLDKFAASQEYIVQ